MQNVVKVFAFLTLSDVGERIYTKYYPERASKRASIWREGSLSERRVQVDFERCLQERLLKLDVERLKDQQVEIISIGLFTVVVTKLHKMKLFVVGQQGENQIVLSELLLCLYRCFKAMLADSSIASIYRAYPDLAVAVDEVVEGGIPVTLDSEQILKTLRLKGQSQQAQAGQGVMGSLFGFAKKGFGF